MIRPSPQLLPSRRSAENAASAFDYEMAQEKACALGRLGRALETALQDLRDFDAAHRDAPPDQKARLQLVARAGQALWEFLVQREACGLRDSRMVMRDYKIPAEVRNRTGIFPAKPPVK